MGFKESQLKILLSLSLLSDLFSFSAKVGTVFYFFSLLSGGEVSFTKCFFICLLLRSSLMGFYFFLNRKQLDEKIKESVDRINGVTKDESIS